MNARRDVIAAVRRIPKGRWITFGELAEMAGHPGAARAAGRITHAHRSDYVDPTWRVFKADGRLPNVPGEAWGREGWHYVFEEFWREEGLVELINRRYWASPGRHWDEYS